MMKPGERWEAAMRSGDLNEAWRITDALEAARRAGDSAGPNHLLWDGRALKGERVLIRCLHGLGDTIQFARFVPSLASLAKSVRFLVQPCLVELLHSQAGMGSVGNIWTDFHERGSVELEVMELAYALRATPSEIAAAVPCLRVDRDGGRQGAASPRIGFVWASSAWDRSRSLDPESLQRMLDVPDVEFFNLTQAAPVEGHWTDVSLHTRDVRAAASFMCGLDLIIAVDTFAVHLAGSLGCPVWVLLRRHADWRWGAEPDRTFWYPTARLFRQDEARDWVRVVERVRKALIRRDF
ncbi:MAG: hypothetical protein SFU53_07960 [Terrimicrobiaceae bacterium]|nr:hypothetical protein [Terrimicrobiaceae bacterium]